MPGKNHIIKVWMDNRVQPGETTLKEYEDHSHKEGWCSVTATKIDDPVTGKLQYIELSVPPGFSQAAKDKINGNRGKSRVVGPVPACMIHTDMQNITSVTALNSAVFTPPPEFGGPVPTQLTTAFAPSTFVSPFLFPAIVSAAMSNPGGAGNTYSDFNNNPDTSLNNCTILGITNASTSAAVTLAALDIALTPDGTPITLANISPIVVPLTTAALNFKQYWVDDDGKLYFRNSFINGLFSSVVDFATAVTAGAV